MTSGWRGVAAMLCLWPGVLAAQQASAQRLGGGGDADVSVGRIVLSLVICVIIAVLAILLIRARTGRSDLSALFARIDAGTRAIDVAETRRMSPHADACLLRYRGREYLLVLQPGNVVVLRDEAVAPEEPPCA